MVWSGMILRFMKVMGGPPLLLIVRLKEALSIFPVIWRLISGNAAYG